MKENISEATPEETEISHVDLGHSAGHSALRPSQGRQRVLGGGELGGDSSGWVVRGGEGWLELWTKPTFLLVPFQTRSPGKPELGRWATSSR